MEERIRFNEGFQSVESISKRLQQVVIKSSSRKSALKSLQKAYDLSTYRANELSRRLDVVTEYYTRSCAESSNKSSIIRTLEDACVRYHKDILNGYPECDRFHIPMI